MTSADLVTIAGYFFASWATGFASGYMVYTLRTLADKL